MTTDDDYKERKRRPYDFEMRPPRSQETRLFSETGVTEYEMRPQRSRMMRFLDGEVVQIDVEDTTQLRQMVREFYDE